MPKPHGTDCDPFHGAARIPNLDVFADPECVLGQEEHTRDDVADEGLRAKAERDTARIGVMFTLSEAKQTSVAMERSATKRKLRSTGATVCNRVAMAWWPSSPCAILIEGPSALWSRMLRTSCHSQYVLTIVEAVTTKPQPRCSPSWAFAVASGLTRQTRARTRTNTARATIRSTRRKISLRMECAEGSVPSAG